MKRSMLGYSLGIVMLSSLVFLASCGGGPEAELLENIPEVPEAPIEGKEIVDIPEIIVPVGETFTFTLTIHRVGHSTSQGVNMMIEERADVEVMGEKDLLHGIGTGPAHFIPIVGDPCNMECFFWMEYEIKGYFKPHPECDLVLFV